LEGDEMQGDIRRTFRSEIDPGIFAFACLFAQASAEAISGLSSDSMKAAKGRLNQDVFATFFITPPFPLLPQEGVNSST